MGHLLKRQIVVAFVCFSLTSSILEARKEDLERAAELAVERSAERAAERAVEKALEAGNQTSTTITVKESYSNARKTAEEQAAPGSESTRPIDGKTSIFESKDFPESPDYELPLSEQEYTDDNDTRAQSDYDDSREYDYNEPKGYNDYNDSRGLDDYENDYDSNYPKNVSEPSVIKNDPTKNDYDEARLEDADEDYAFPNDTDYQKLNKSKQSNSEISETFGDFDSDFRNEFGSKLTNAGAKLPDASLDDDLKFYSGADFLKKKDSKKVAKVVEEVDDDEEEPDYKHDDTWKSYSDWHKDFKSISEESFPNGSFWDDDDDSLKMWSDDEEIAEKKSQIVKQNIPSPTIKSSDSKDFDFKTWQSDDDEDDDDIDDNVPAADDVIETDAGVKDKKSNSYRRSSRDDYYYKPGPVYPGNLPSEEMSTEKIATTSRSPASKFRNTFRERSRAQYQKIMLGRSAEGIRRSPYSYNAGNKYQNFTERGNLTEFIKRPEYRPIYVETEDSGYDPFKDLTTYRVYPRDADKVTKIPSISNRSIPISPPINPPIGLNQGSIQGNLQGHIQGKIPGTIQRNIQRNIEENIQESIQEKFKGNLQSILQSNPQKSLEDNLQGSYHKIPRRPSLIQLPPKMPKLETDEDMPPIPSSMLTVPKSTPSDVVKMKKPHPYDIITSQRPQRIPMRKHQKFVPDSQLPLFINTALPGPFHITKQQTIVHDNRPFTIHLDKSIPIALRKRRPFIVHLPLKPYEKQMRPDNRLATNVESDSAVSENRLRKIRWSLS